MGHSTAILPAASDPAPPKDAITRSTFISPDHYKNATTLSTMYVVSDDGQGVTEVPAPARVKESGIIPEGYCVGEFFVLPFTLNHSLLYGPNTES
jgi:hypothetical protein